MLELRQLRYFLTVAEDLSVTAAARRLQMAQPALSQALTRMERQLGTSLFHRASGRLTLTAAGRSLLPEARVLLRRAEEVTGLVSRTHGRERTVLRIGSIASGLSGILPQVLPEFLGDHPTILPRVYELGQRAQLDALRAGAIDIGVCRLLHADADDEGEEVALHPLGHERLYCAVSETHEIASSSSVGLSALAGEDLVTFPREMAPVAYDTLVGVCMRAGFSPRFTQEASNDQAILGLVACGVSTALVPEMTTRVSVPGVAFVPVEDDYAVTPLSAILYADPPPAAVDLAAALARVAME